jgi:predicted metal-dependent phosphotriesterase family hydrolase
VTFVRTVLGDVEPSSLGRVDYHEHLFQVSPLLPGDELDDESASAAEARLLLGSGFDTMVDATPIGLGRRPEAVARISRSTGLAVVATTGVHREAHYPAGHWLRDVGADGRRKLFLADLLHGMPASDTPPVGAGSGATPAAGDDEARGDTADSVPPGPVDRVPVRAGLVKAGVGYWSISAFERQTLDAVGAAAAETGAPVMIHLEFCTAAHEVLDLLLATGVPESRVVLAHADRDPDPGLHLDLIARGAWLGYDGMARPRTRSDAELLALTEAVVAGGGGPNLLLGGDVARRTRYAAYGGMPGLAYLGARYVPRLRERIGEDAIEQLLVANPQRFLRWA